MFHPPPVARLARLAATVLLGSAALCGCSSGSKNEVDPERMLDLHREMALSYFDQGDLLRAEDQVNKGLTIDPKDDMLLLMFGWIRQRRGGRDDILVAERVFRKQLKMDDYRVELGLAEALERKGMFYSQASDAIASGERETQAKDPALRAVELSGESTSMWNESVQWYRRVLDRRPDDPQAMNGLQRVYALLGQDQESLRWAQALILQTKAELDFWVKRLERPDITAQDELRFRDIITRTTDLLAATHMHAALLAKRMDDPEVALKHLDEALLLEPESAGTYSRRAEVLCELGRFDEAIPSIDEFLRLSQLEFDHPDIQRAFQFRAECEAALAAR